MNLKLLNLLSILFFIGYVSAFSTISVNTFNNSLTSENITLSSSNNFKGFSSNYTVIDNILGTCSHGTDNGVGNIYINFSLSHISSNLSYYSEYLGSNLTSIDSFIYCRNSSSVSWSNTGQIITIVFS